MQIVLENVLEEKPDSNLESLEFEVCGHRFSSVARQLFAVIEDKPSLSCFLDYARLIERRYSELEVKVFKIVSVDRDELVLEDSIDYLREPGSDARIRLQMLGQFDFV